MGEGVTAQPTCPTSALLCSANSLGERWGTHRGRNLFQVRCQGCDRDVGGTSNQDLWVPVAPQAPCLTVATPAPNGSGARGCADAAGGVWSESSGVSLGHSGPPALGKLVTLGGICLGWSGWGVPIGAVSWALSPPEVTQPRWWSPLQDVLSREVEPTLK